MGMQELPIYEAPVRGILTATSGFIREAGFSHSLTPARNCTFGCTYCYVPTMGIYGGLKPPEWQRWGQFTTFKSNAPDLLRKQLRKDQMIYCSPLVDPYQPAEERRQAMRPILAAIAERPPALFVIQTRGPLILRDLDLLRTLARHTTVRVSFSLTTDREDVRRWFEPHCAPLEERLRAIERLREEGIEVFATLAPLLPSNIERLVEAALQATTQDIIGDPLHIREHKRHGATTRQAAFGIAGVRGFREWLDPDFQVRLTARIAELVERAGRRFAAGPEGFSWLAALPAGAGGSIDASTRRNTAEGTGGSRQAWRSAREFGSVLGRVDR